MSQPYVDGIADKVSHDFASGLTADLIAADKDRVTITMVCPDRWFLGDFAVVTSRDGLAFAGEVESMDVCTGEVMIRGVGQPSARTTPLPCLRTPDHGRPAAGHAGLNKPGVLREPAGIQEQRLAVPVTYPAAPGCRVASS